MSLVQHKGILFLQPSEIDHMEHRGNVTVLTGILEILGNFAPHFKGYEYLEVEPSLP